MPKPKPLYGDSLEPVIITSMVLLILLSFAGVALLWNHYSEDCHSMNYTYCPKSDAPSSDHH